MDYVPIDAFRYATASSVTGPALFLPRRAHSEAILLTSGPEPMICFLDGAHAGDGFPATSDGNFGALVFENIEFQVDWSSKFDYSLIDIPLGALVVHDTGVDVIIAVRNVHGFNDARRYPLKGAGISSDRSEDAGFSKWKAFQRRNGELFEVYAFEASRKGNA